MKIVAPILFLALVASALVLLSCQTEKPAQPSAAAAKPARAFLGFDRNLFPDAQALAVLRKTFSFTGYWLSPPPGETANTWTGQRETLRAHGFGFLLLYRGPLSRELKGKAAAANRGTADARSAATEAAREGFPAHAIIFVDIEEGGRLSDAYHAYLGAWTAELVKQGYRAGAYCSGIPVKEEPGNTTITTAEDIRAHLSGQDFSYFVFNDACPPSPGCVFPSPPAAPTESGTQYAEVWQFVRSPREMEFSAHCPPGYHTDGNCYAPGDTGHVWFLDVSTAASADPSNGR